MDVSREIQAALQPGETVEWTGRPHRASYMWARIPRALRQFAPFWLLPLIYVVMFMVLETGADGGARFPFDLGLILPWVIVAAVLLIVAAIIVEILRYRAILYVFTNRRALLQRGVIGRDMHIIDYNRITDFVVVRGLADVLGRANAGTIAIHSAADSADMTGGLLSNVMVHVADAYRLQGELVRLKERGLRPAPAVANPPPLPPPPPVVVPYSTPGPAATAAPAGSRSAARKGQRPPPRKRRGSSA